MPLMQRAASRPRKLKVYLAGPDVFLPNAVEIGRLKKTLCAQYGFKGLYPFDNEIPPDDKTAGTDILIYRANAKMIALADCGIFNLTPFRGPSADVGTVFELGMLIALGKPAFAYTNDNRDLIARVRDSSSAAADHGSRVDRDELTIEDFGNADNLMIDAALREQGHPIIRCDAPGHERLADLRGFESCLRLAAERLAPGREARLRSARGMG